MKKKVYLKMSESCILGSHGSRTTLEIFEGDIEKDKKMYGDETTTLRYFIIKEVFKWKRYLNKSSESWGRRKMAKMEEFRYVCEVCKHESKWKESIMEHMKGHVKIKIIKSEFEEIKEDER